MALYAYYIFIYTSKIVVVRGVTEDEENAAHTAQTFRPLCRESINICILLPLNRDSGRLLVVELTPIEGTLDAHTGRSNASFHLKSGVGVWWSRAPFFI